jgi:pimeloyl-ACP methyl ester carboxylesterase
MSTSAESRARMLAGLRVTRRRLDVAGISTSVIEAGQGPPLVLLHGGIECGGIYWAPVLALLAERHHVVVPDAPGLGESEPVDRLDVETFAGWLQDLLALTDATQPILVSHSLLGTLAARYAARHGDLLDQLVIYGAPGIGPYRMPAGLVYAAIRFDIRQSARNSQRFERFALLDLEATHERDPGWFEAFDFYTRARARVPHVKRTMRRLVRAETQQIPDHELRRINTPTSLVWGRHDRMAPLRLADRASAAFGWPLQVIEDAAHVPHIEQPEAFVQALAAIESVTTDTREGTT